MVITQLSLELHFGAILHSLDADMIMKKKKMALLCKRESRFSKLLSKRVILALSFFLSVHWMALVLARGTQFISNPVYQ